VPGGCSPRRRGGKGGGGEHRGNEVSRDRALPVAALCGRRSMHRGQRKAKQMESLKRTGETSAEDGRGRREPIGLRKRKKRESDTQSISMSAEDGHGF
jgi:hypothetical protein